MGLVGKNWKPKKVDEYRAHYNAIQDEIERIVNNKGTQPEDEPEPLDSQYCADMIMYTLNPSDLDAMKVYRSFCFKYGLKRDLWKKSAECMKSTGKSYWTVQERYEVFRELCEKDRENDGE